MDGTGMEGHKNLWHRIDNRHGMAWHGMAGTVWYDEINQGRAGQYRSG